MKGRLKAKLSNKAKGHVGLSPQTAPLSKWVAYKSFAITVQFLSEDYTLSKQP